MTWIFFTIVAATLQTFRNLEQKSLNTKLDDFTVSWSRFILPLPLALLVVIFSFSSVTGLFIFFCLIMSIFQILGNVFLLRTIKSKNFSVGIAFFKTEVLQTLILGLLLFNQSVTFLGFVSILITTFGMILMSNFRVDKKFQLDQTALFGALCGFTFAFSAFFLKFAANELISLGYGSLRTSLTVLLWVIAFQNLSFVAIKLYQKRFIEDVNSLFCLKNKASFFKMGILSFTGSICWFLAFTIGDVIYVKVVGQIELIMAILVSHSYLKERHSIKETVGIIFVFTGIISLILYH